jgi:predicted nucleic acid-binding protein
MTWGVCYEFLRVITHPKVLRVPWSSAAAVEFLEAVQAAPALSMLVPTERHGSVLDEVTSMVPRISGNLWHDTETAVLMREHGIRRICTRDMDFHRFPFLEPVDPLVAAP